jgi:hypothetical protein
MIANKVKIGSIIYDVTRTDKPLILNGCECSGVIHYEEASIELKQDRNEQKIEQTWWHEVLHGITRERGINWGENDELYTDELAKALHALMVDNPYPLPGQKSEV